MIRSILILTYILAVLLASGLARAEYAPVTGAGYEVPISDLPLNAVVAPDEDVTVLNDETKKKSEHKLGLIFVNEISSVPLQ